MKRIITLTLVLFLTIPSMISHAEQPINLYLSGKLISDSGKIINQTTFVPLRLLIMHMGAKVDWKNSTKTVTVRYEQTAIQLTIGNKKVNKNGSEFTLRAAPKIINDKTMVPIRFISESFGSTVEWDGSSKSVYIDGRLESESDFEELLIQFVNRERRKRGLEPLIVDPELEKVAKVKSQNMFDFEYYGHNSVTFGTPFDMLDHYDISYTLFGENIAVGYETPKEVVEESMNSEDNRRNIVHDEFTHIGVGYVKGGKYKHYITLMFIKK